MSFQFVFFPEVAGKAAAIIHDGSDQEAAILAAGQELLICEVASVRIIAADDSGAEVCCLRADGNGGFARDDKP